MAQGTSIKKADRQQLLVGAKNGVTVIPSPTPLTRLHYFDGKFLRARDLELEQSYLRQLVALSNRAGGAGVVHGFDLDLAGNALELGPGLAIDGEGRVLLLPEAHSLDVAALLEASRLRYADSLPAPLPFPGGFGCCGGAAADEPGTVAEGATFYLISICHAEALCGEEDVYGKLCAPACSGATARPYTLEGVAVRALPLDLASVLPASPASPVPLTGKHLRSRVAAAYFADERRRVASLISEGGLKSAAWCHGAAADAAGCVPLGLLARAGAVTLFLDTWTVRRERIEAPPRRYWAAVMAMRPWDVFLAQVLQFQCQLACCVAGQPPQPPGDPCGEAQELLRRTAEQLALLIRDAAPPAAVAAAGLAGGAGGAAAGKLDYQRLEEIRGRLADAAETAAAPVTERRLLHCGIVELPSAGYLPIDPRSQLTVNQQVFGMMGESVDLRFCVVRPDFVPHAFEEAQHMDRISLLRGYDQPNDKPRVDILVPDGELEERRGEVPGTGYVFDLELARGILDGFGELAPFGAFGNLAGGAAVPKATIILGSFETNVVVRGAARGETTAGGAIAFYFAGRTPAAAPPGGTGNPNTETSGRFWLACELNRDPFDLETNAVAALNAEAVIDESAGDERQTMSLRLIGELTVAGRTVSPAGVRLSARLSGSLAVLRRRDGAETSRVVFVKENLLLDRLPGAGFGAAHGLVVQRLGLFSTVIAVGAQRAFTEAGKALLQGVGKSPSDPPEILFKGTQVVDEDALLPGHPAHDASISALAVLGAGLGDPAFADARARRLFPPPQGGTDQLVVRARLPWVLFHRRREKICSAAAAPAKVEARRLRLYHIRLDRREQIESLRHLLEDGNGLDNYNPAFVATVDFAAGLAAVDSPFEILRDSWDQAVEDGSQLVFGAIAGTGKIVAEGETLARTRLESLAEVLAEVTPPGSPEYELLDAIHPDLPANGLDGAILYATIKGTAIPEPEPVVATVCQTVYVLNSPIGEGDLKERTVAIAKTGFAAADFPNLNGMVLTQALFNAADATPRGDLEEVEKKVRDQLGLDPSRMVILTVSRSGSTAKERKIHDKRSNELLNAIGAQSLLPSVLDGGKNPFPFDCPAVSVLLIRG